MTLIAEFTALLFHDRNKKWKESSVSSVADKTSGWEMSKIENAINIQRNFPKDWELIGGECPLANAV